MMTFSATVAFVFFLFACSGAEAALNAQHNLLNAHRNYRAAVLPRASNMQPMNWDSELEAKAQGYADKCIWGHNPDRTSPLGNVGENLYLTTGNPSNYSVAVTNWNNEKVFYDYATNKCQAGKVCGHYTQVVWASSNKLGCGATLCQTLQNIAFKNALLVVCNYHLPGNFVGQKPYAAAREEVEELVSEDAWNENGEESEFNSEEEEGLQKLYSETDDANLEENRASDKMNTEETVAELRSLLRETN